MFRYIWISSCMNYLLETPLLLDFDLLECLSLLSQSNCKNQRCFWSQSVLQRISSRLNIAWCIAPILKNKCEYLKLCIKIKRFFIWHNRILIITWIKNKPQLKYTHYAEWYFFFFQTQNDAQYISQPSNSLKVIYVFKRKLTLH